MFQSDKSKLLILQSDKSKNSWLWVVGFIWGAPDVEDVDVKTHSLIAARRICAAAAYIDPLQLHVR